jgi:hypothetical protein
MTWAPATDDPEAPFRRWPAARRRWTRSTIWRRIRLPIRRRRWLRENRTACAPYAKAAEPTSTGVVVALGDFSGENGLSLAAIRELERLRRTHGTVEVIDCGAAHHGRGPIEVHDGPEVGLLYLLSAPDTYARFLSSLPPARVAQARRIGLWFWETPCVSDQWDFAFGVVHEIWTFSDYSRRAIESAGRGIPVEVRAYPAPDPVPPAAEPPGGWRAAFGVERDAFLGIAVMDLRSCPARKNPWAHVAAWQAAFGDDPRHVLIMKFRLSKRTACVRDELREMIGGATNIRLVEEYLEPGALAALQASADVYLSLHRAEGYGLVIREMLELGIPVVATNWSANAEYGPAYPHYRGVPWRLVPYRDWTGHYPGATFSWAEADVAAAAAELRQIACRRHQGTG